MQINQLTSISRQTRIRRHYHQNHNLTVRVLSCPGNTQSPKIDRAFICNIVAFGLDFMYMGSTPAIHEATTLTVSDLEETMVEHATELVKTKVIAWANKYHVYYWLKRSCKSVFFKI